MRKPSIRMSNLFCLLLAAAVPIGANQAVGRNKQVTAVEFQRKTIYHSPQTPGFTCWTGTWLMPDGSIMVCFTQATGPLECRPRAPKEVLHKLSWPPKGDARYDMTGLDLRNVHLRSAEVIAEGLVDLGLLKGAPSDLVERGAHTVFFTRDARFK